MNNNYILKSTNSDKFNFICFSLDTTRPDEYFKSLEEELKKTKKTCFVLLDLYRSNGNGNRRFFKLFFNGVKLNLNNIEKINKDNIEKKVFNDCQYFYATN